jgi:hypothetical protein
MNQSKEINKLRKAFRLQYNSFRSNYNELGLRLFELSKQADLLLNCIEELNNVEVGFQ